MVQYPRYTQPSLLQSPLPPVRCRKQLSLLHSTLHIRPGTWCLSFLPALSTTLMFMPSSASTSSTFFRLLARTLHGVGGQNNTVSYGRYQAIFSISFFFLLSNSRYPLGRYMGQSPVASLSACR